MSWEEAKRDAGLWLDQLQLRRPRDGEALDLRPYSDRLLFKGRRRVIVINAIRRIMKRRGVNVILPDNFVADLARSRDEDQSQGELSRRVVEGDGAATIAPGLRKFRESLGGSSA